MFIRRRSSWAVVFVALMAAAMPGLASGPPAVRQIAITIDDLPKVVPPPAHPEDTNQTYLSLVHIISVLRAHHAPAIGFVIGRNIDGPDRAAQRAMVRLWLNSGLMIGNHSYSHANLCESTGNTFTDDVLRGDQVLRALTPGSPPPRYFRLPYLCTGRTRAEKLAFAQFLQAHHWINTPVTIDPGDYMFNELYLAARARRDEALQQRIRREYLGHVRSLLDYFEDLARQLFHRDPPQVLLVHSNDLNTDCLNDLLLLLEERGYQFVTLDRALADPAYATPDEYIGTRGISWLHRWQVAFGLPLDVSHQPPIPGWLVYEVEKLHQAR